MEDLSRDLGLEDILGGDLDPEDVLGHRLLILGTGVILRSFFCFNFVLC